MIKASFYSDKLNKKFETEEEAILAEAEFDAEQDRIANKKKAEAAEKEKCACAVKDANDAVSKAYNELKARKEEADGILDIYKEKIDAVNRKRDEEIDALKREYDSKIDEILGPAEDALDEAKGKLCTSVKDYYNKYVTSHITTPISFIIKDFFKN